MTEDISKKWFEFMNEAQTCLLRGQIIDRFKLNIQVALEPSFDSSIFLQLEINDDLVKWYRTTWPRLIDAVKFYDPIENLKYVGQKIKPTIKHENGTTSKESIKDIIDFAKTISVKPRLDKWGGIILDGVSYTLTIGIESTQTTYKWHYLPNEWTGLQKLANMLEELNKKLPQ